jgi:hypothetical protein
MLRSNQLSYISENLEGCAVRNKIITRFFRVFGAQKRKQGKPAKPRAGCGYSSGMNLTGGWHWHWRAWRSQQSWAATSAQISDWLLAQDMPQRELVLIGASAGWMLPTTWLLRFEHIHHWDIDPLAGRLFRWRHGRALQQHGIALDIHCGDGLTGLHEIIAAHPQAFYWFDNVLGQLRFATPNLSALEVRLRQMHKALRQVAWGSLHDRMSGPVTRQPTQPSAQLSRAGLTATSTEVQAWLGRMGAVSPWLDHLTEGVLPPGTPVQYTAWPFKPGYAHWLEMGWVAANSLGAGPAY